MRRRTVRTLSRLHAVVFRATLGRVGRRLVDNDMLILTTTGRRTGRRHVTPLLYLRDGDDLVVFASYGGRPHHPDWYENLMAGSVALVDLPGERFTVRARTAGPGEREQWWRRAVDAYEGYAGYQARTDRQIPVVILTPAPA